MKACRQGRSSRSTAVIHAGRRSWWRPVIISAKAVTWPAVAFAFRLRALIFISLAVSPSVRWPGWLVIHPVTSPDGRPGQRGTPLPGPPGCRSAGSGAGSGDEQLCARYRAS